MTISSRNLVVCGSLHSATVFSEWNIVDTSHEGSRWGTEQEEGGRGGACHTRPPGFHMIQGRSGERSSRPWISPPSPCDCSGSTWLQTAKTIIFFRHAPMIIVATGPRASERRCKNAAMLITRA